MTPDDRFRWPQPASTFVGREGEHARLAALLADHPVVGVTGTVGIGKTELVLQTVQAEHRAGRAAPPAYTSLAGARTAEHITERVARAVRLEARALLEGRRRAPPVLELLEQRPCTLVCDDVQDASPQALRAAAAGLGRARGAWRVLLVSRGPLAVYDASVGIPTLEVEPLPLDAGRKLVAALAGGSARGPQQRILHEAGGNPLLVKLLLSGRAHDGSSCPAVVLDQLVPDLTEPARRLLELLATARVPMEQQELHALRLLAATTLLERQGLIVRRGTDVTLAPGVRPLLRQDVEPEKRFAHTLVHLGRQRLAAAPRGGEGLQLACRGLLLGSDPAGALAVARGHRAAVDRLTAAELESLARALGSVQSAAALELLLFLLTELLRRGALEPVRRLLERTLEQPDCEPVVARQLYLLRAATHLLRGEVTLAARATEGARRAGPAGPDPALEVARAEVSVLRGDLVTARRALVAVALDHGHAPALRSRSAVALGISYLLEERPDVAAAWLRRARRDGASEQPHVLELLARGAEVLARLALDQIAAAAALVEEVARRWQSADPHVSALGAAACAFLEEAVAGRRGACERPAAGVAPGLAPVERRGSPALRALSAHFRAAAAVAAGRLGQAAHQVEVLACTIAESGLTGLTALGELDQARLARARGDDDLGRGALRHAARVAPGSALVRIEVAALEDRLDPAHLAGHPPAIQARAALRLAEGALAAGRLEDARRHARAAERWYERAGARHDLAAALLLTAEEAVRRGAAADARDALRACEQLASAGGCLPLRVGAACVRAALADREGALEEYVRSLAEAYTLAGEELADESLRSACVRAGLTVTPRRCGAAPWAALVERLGLARPGELLLLGGGVRLLSAAEARSLDHDLALDLVAGEVRGRTRRCDLSHQRILARVLELLVHAGPEGLTAESLYRLVWGAAEYHGLRDRGRLYTALTRVRQVLRQLMGRTVVELTLDGRYRLARDLRAAVLYPADPPHGAEQRRSRIRQARGRADEDPATYAHRFEIPLAHARWELAVAAIEDEP